jgi:2',3'-cyclic-nucleotide 2'-phosphodiesterase (5'-nucleotidase family)
MQKAVVIALGGLVGCGGSGVAPESPESRAPPSAPTISVVGTTDLHGRLESLPILGGFAANLRRDRQEDGGVLLVDSGDVFQGTLESNLDEGATALEAYSALGYAGVAIGNHEFDYGPAGDRQPGPGVDPQGALKERVRQARFAMLAANLIDRDTGAPPAWQGLRPSAIVDVAGVRVGLIGVLSEETPSIVMALFFEGLDVSPIVPAALRESARLRSEGARIVLLLAHAGGACRDLSDANDATSCDRESEIARTVAALPPGAVDAVFAGHTHQGMAHFLSGVPVVQAYAYGRAFSRVDFDLGGPRPKPTIHPPRELCASAGSFADCEPGDYSGPVEREDRVAAVIAPALARARERRSRLLGVRVAAPMTESYASPSPLGNLFADLLREAAPGADVGLMNGGGLRAPLPSGELSYGALYEAMPFDNQLAIVRLTGAELARVLGQHLASAAHGILSVSGLSVTAACRAGELTVTLRRPNGARVRDDEQLRIATSDYLALGGDELFAPVALSPERIEVRPELAREAFARVLSARGGMLDPSSPALATARLSLPGPRPIACAGAGQ